MKKPIRQELLDELLADLAWAGTVKCMAGAAFVLAALIAIWATIRG